MKILILCDQGNNRSVVLASRLKYCGDGHDILTAGLETNSSPTLKMLYQWADHVILTEESQWDQWRLFYEEPWKYKSELWNIGPDNYPRPHNKELLSIVTKLIDEHPEYKEKHGASE